MITASNVHWIAGFLDGEGWFGHHGRKVSITACQKDEWHVRQLQKLLGGRVYRYENRWRDGKEALWYWRWEIHGRRAAGIMMTVYILMSPRRQQRIRDCLQFFKDIGRRGKHYGSMTHCTHGHEYTPENTIQKKTGRQCRECMRKYQRDYLVRKRAETEA